MRGYWLSAPLVLLAAPASAQIWGGPSGTGISGGTPAAMRASSIAPRNGETDQIRRNVRHGLDSGQLSRRESRQLWREANQIDRLEARYSRDGLSDAEAAELAVRRQLLRDDVNAKRNGAR